MSELNIARQQVASANVQSQLGAETLQINSGARKGDAATAVAKNSDLSDIQEEIGNAVGKFADKRTLGQAKIRQGAGVNMEALKRIADYYEKLPDMPREAELRDLVSKLQAFEDLISGGGGGGSAPTADDILQALRDFSGDVTHQFEALQVAQRYFETSEASDEFAALLDKAEQAFSDPDIARDVQAGYAVAKGAADLAPTLETSPGALRDTYREMLRSEKHMGQLFDQLSTFNIRLKFVEVVDLFLKTAGAELSNQDSQVDPIILGALTRELGALKEMQTVFEEGGRLIAQTKRIDPDFGANGDGSEQVKLTSDMLNFSAKSAPSMSDARQLVKDFEPAAEKTLVVFANGLHDLHRLISDRSVTSDSARLQQSAAIQNLCIERSAAEEAAFSAQLH